MQRNLQTVAKLATESGGAFSESSLRWMIFNAANNGMDAARVIYRVGKRKVLLDVDAFQRWIDSQQQRGAA